MTKVVRRPEVGQEVWITIDVARSKWAFNVRWSGAEQRRLSTPGAIEHLHSLVQSYAGCRVHVAYESCGFGYEIAWWCQEQAIAVTVIPPSTLERAPGAHVKTDRVDAAAMNFKHEKGLLKCVHIPTRTEHEQRQVSRTYGQVLKDRKRAQMRLRSLMQEHGRLGPVPQAGWARYEGWLRRQEMPAPVALSIELLLAARAVAAQGTLRLRAALRQLARHPEYQPVVQRLSQQAGVGWFTAIRLRLEIGDIGRFTTADSFVHYLGLTPSEYSSGDTVHRGHLLKCGPGVVRGWLLQCAWAAATGRSPDPEFVACYQRLVGRAGKKRAIVAVARRLALRLRARWLEELAKAEKGREEAKKKAA
jgi:transposase